jgi:hypothetical protein
LLVRDVAIDAERERIAVREYVPEREEHSRHPEARIADQVSEGGEPSEREPRRRIQRVRVEHAGQRNVHEEALGCALGFRQSLVLQVGTHDARVVCPVPVAARWFRAELQPELDGPRRGLASTASE